VHGCFGRKKNGKLVVEHSNNKSERTRESKGKIKPNAVYDKKHNNIKELFIKTFFINWQNENGTKKNGQRVNNFQRITYKMQFILYLYEKKKKKIQCNSLLRSGDPKMVWWLT
jgi:hypothetical protein